MSKHLWNAMGRLKQEIYAVSTLVEENLHKAVDAIETRNGALAAAVIDSDTQIDLREVFIEEECLKTLALFQPVATDLRFIVSVLKLNNDLERIGDLAVNIADRALHLAKLTVPPGALEAFDFHEMAVQAQNMVKRSLDALVDRDGRMARRVTEADDQVDAMNRKHYQQVETLIREQPEHLEVFLLLLSVSRQLERVADHATNIAEDVIYMVEGNIIRHRKSSGQDSPDTTQYCGTKQSRDSQTNNT
ncbi:MAG: phosphate transport system regulatory protein PhoU [Lentisphaerae bacterium RIFOXYC12_FULL_60_16]|nr:MAG: phosphate transport system regulatory protein PhoU [Lentisphaerae bacterium RIFOXYC12_FULL_60_16]